MLFRDLGAPEIIIILIIVLLLFGPGRIGKLAGELGKSIRLFREGVSGDSKDEPASETTAQKDNKQA